MVPGVPAMPRLVLDLQAAQSRTFGERGIARWATSFAAALVEAGGPVEALLLNPAEPVPDLPAPLAGHPGLGPNTAGAAREWAGAAYHVLSPFERGRPVDAVLAPHALDAAGALVATFYDAIPFALASIYLADPATRRFMEARRRLLHRCDRLLAISEHSRRDATRRLGLDPTRIVTVGAGASPWFCPAPPGDDPADRVRAALPAIRGRYVMTVSGWVPHKNPVALIDAWGRVPPAVRAGRQLVVTCAVPEEAHGFVAARAAEAGLAPHDVVLTGRVDDELLRDLYRGAELFVFASLYEGFGLPVLEAARCGTPAVTSATTATPEVLDHHEGTFDPDDPADMATVIARGLTDDAFRDGLRAAAGRAAQRHTWAAVAARALDAYAGLEPRPRRRPRAERLCVALTGPLPPAPGGVARYTARVAAALGRRVALDCYAEASPWGGGPRSHRHLPVAAFGTSLSPWSYDAVVHVLGNSNQHVEAARLALRHPGVVWLHEIDLGALAGLLGRPDGGDVGDGLLADLLRVSRAAIVTTAAAAAQLQRRFPDGPPVAVVPLPVPRPDELGLADDADDDGDGAAGAEDGLVVCFGLVDPAKRPLDVVAACGLAARQVGRPLRLAFVGPAGADDADAIRAAAAGERDLAVEVTGHVDDATYGAWLRRASVAVQLRAVGRGEGSGTVADAIGAGVPVVTNVAAAAELPEGVAAVLPLDATPADVAAPLARLLTDHAARDAMRRAQAAYAAAWDADAVAARVAELLADPAWQGVGGALATATAEPLIPSARPR